MASSSRLAWGYILDLVLKKKKQQQTKMIASVPVSTLNMRTRTGEILFRQCMLLKPRQLPKKLAPVCGCCLKYYEYVYVCVCVHVLACIAACVHICIVLVHANMLVHM